MRADSPDAYWRLGESSGTTAADSSGNGKTGTYQNSPTLGTTGLLTGDSDTAVALNGTNQRVDVPSGSVSLPSTSSAFSVEAWFETSSTSGIQIVFSARSSNFSYPFIRMYVSAGVLYGSIEADWEFSAYQVVGPAVADGNTHYAVFTRDSSGILHLFLDGSEVASASDTGPYAGTSTGLSAQEIGADARDGNYFNGTIDEVALYHVALSRAQVAAHYTAGSGAPTVAVSDAYSQAVVGDSPDGYWRLGEATGVRAIDSSGGGSPAVRLGASDGAGGLLSASADTAAGFEGTDDGIAVAPNMVTLPSTSSAFSVEAWFETSSSSGTQTIFSARSSNSSYPFIRMYVSSGVLYGSIEADSELTAYQVVGPAVADGKPHYAVFTRDSSGTLHLFVDGSEVATSGDTGPYSGTSTGLDWQRIGADARDGNYFSGTIDEVALYHAALSRAQVAAHYTAGASVPTTAVSDGYSAAVLTDTPSGYWRLGESFGLRAIDSSGNGSPGVRLRGVTANAPGLLNAATDTASAFDGVSGSIGVAPNMVTLPSTSSAFSVEAWFETSSSSGTQTIFSARSSNSSYPFIRMYVSSGVLYGSIEADSELTAYQVVGPAVADGKPHYAVFTRDSSGTLHLFVDGSEVATGGDTGPYSGTSTGLDWQRIGADARDGNYFSGTIDEVALYASALPAARVLAHFQAGSIGSPPGSVPSAPVAQTFGNDGGVDIINPSASLDNVNTATGAYSTQVTDASLPGIGVPFSFQRTYTSANSAGGRFGPGWTDSYAASLTIRPGGGVVLFSENGQSEAFASSGGGAYTGSSGSLSTLTQVGSNYQLVRHDQTKLTFDSTGKLLSEVDRNGEGLTFTYSGANLSTITDSAGRVITVSTNPDGTVSKIALPDARSVTYGYTNGRLTSVVDLRGHTWTYHYDANGLLDKITDPNSHTAVAVTYDTNKRVSREVDGLNHATTFSWNLANQTETITSPNGGVTKDIYSNNILVQTIDPLVHTTSYSYDANFNQTGITDPRSNTTAMTYDGSHNMLTRTAPSPLSYQETWTYNSRNDVTSYTDGRGNTTSYGYDSAGDLTSKTQPGSIVTQYGRDPAGTGLLVSLTDPRGKTTTYGYDSQHNLTSITSPLSEETTMSYDSSGRLTSRVDPRGNATGANPADYTTTYTYDNADNKLTQTDPNGHTTSWAYDPVGNRTSVTDANNHTTSYAYDAANELTSVTDPGGAATTYSYDADGNLTGRTDPNNHTTTYTYDNADQRTGTTNPLNQSWNYGYDANGNLTSITAPSGGTTTYTYDALNRRTQVSYSDSTPTVTYSYDANGNRTQMSDGSGTITYTYDALNRLTSTTHGSTGFAYAYDAASNLTSRTYPDNTSTSYSYDNDEHLASATFNGNTISYTYDPAGELTQTTRPAGNDWTETRTYDHAGQLTEIKDANGTSTLQQLDYAYDPVGNATSLTRLSGAEYYQYDNRNRLTKVCYDATCDTATNTIGWTYDTVGNRLTETRPAGTTTYTYDAGDELTQTSGPGGTTSYTYDSNGNETAAGSTSYTYNLANQLASATANSATTTYSYDGDGNRLNATTGSASTNYIWDSNNTLPQLALEQNGGGSTIRDYIQGNDTAALLEGGNTYYYHHDRLGSITDLTSSTGSTEWTYTYEPFGEPRTVTQVDPSAPTNPLGYLGQYTDPASNLLDLRARQYDPGTGRFLSLDPTPAGPSMPYEASYEYAGQDPVNSYDLSGTMTGGPGMPQWPRSAYGCGSVCWGLEGDASDPFWSTKNTIVLVATTFSGPAAEVARFGLIGKAADAAYAAAETSRAASVVRDAGLGATRAAAKMPADAPSWAVNTARVVGAINGAAQRVGASTIGQAAKNAIGKAVLRGRGLRIK